MELAVQRVRDRLLKAASALDAAGIPYAVVDGNAVAAWVARVDEGAVRNTQDVDLLVDRKDLGRIIEALGAVGFVYRHVASVDLFLDGPGAKARDAVHVVFSGEKVRADYSQPAPEIREAERIDNLSVLGLEALVRMKLTSFRRKDQVHVLDLIEVGLVDETWRQRLPPELGARLQELLDNPES